LLKGKCPDEFILSKDLSNYIQQIKRDNSTSCNNISNLLNDLFSEQKDDLLFLVIPCVDQETSRLSGVFWMTSEQQVLYSRYNDVIIHDNTALTNQYFTETLKILTISKRY